MLLRPIIFLLYFSVQASIAAAVAFTEFKTASQSLQSNDQDIELTTETSSDQSLEDSGSSNLEEKTVALKPSEQPSKISTEQGLNSTQSDSKTAAVEEQSSLIESSSNDLSSQVSTAQKQPQQQLLKNNSSVVVLSKKSQEECNSDLNPNCMPVTSQPGSGEDSTTLEPSLAQEPEITRTVDSLDPVTSSLLEGFCSESDADCSLKPTAAMLTQTDKVNTFPSN